jgi:hypothetical protein
MFDEEQDYKCDDTRRKEVVKGSGHTQSNYRGIHESSEHNKRSKDEKILHELLSIWE